MDNNTFFIYNDILYALYDCRSFEELRSTFLLRLKMLIPYSYASILIKDNEAGAKSFYRDDMYCIPPAFEEAERRYTQNSEHDPLLWMIYGGESTLVRESELLSEEDRLKSELYASCYKEFNVIDSLQYSIVSNRQLLGVISLFSTVDAGSFSDTSTFYMRSLGPHINNVFSRLCHEEKKASETSSLHNTDAIARKYNLTSRETEILSLVYQYRDFDEIAETLSITENTVQKHMQNIFRKTCTSSRWELLRY